MVSIRDLLETVKLHGPDIDDACLILGLLLEPGRHLKGVRNSMSAVVGFDIDSMQITDQDYELIVSSLAEYVRTHAKPYPPAVLALSRASSIEAVSTMSQFFHRVVADAEQQTSAFHALQGIMNAPESGAYSKLRKDMIELASMKGIGDVRVAAKDYFKVHNSKLRPKP
jgi:hypothetical protein